jgi:hypothetical protein
MKEVGNCFGRWNIERIAIPPLAIHVIEIVNPSSRFY